MNRAEKSTKPGLSFNASSFPKNILLVILAVAVSSLLLVAVVSDGSNAYRPATVSAIHGTLGRTASTSPEKSRIAEAYGKLPLRFEANRGETDRGVKFIARGSRYTLLLTPNEADLVLSKTSAKAKPQDAIPDRASRQAAVSTTVVRIKLAGGNPQAQVSAANELPGKTNYLIGSDSSKWLTNVPSYARVQAHDVYPGIDVAYYGNGMEMEEDFVVAPGGDPKAIALEVSGAKKVSVNPQGELVLAGSDGDLYLRKPTVYQTIAGARREIQGRYQLRGENRVGFDVGQYDASQPLVIDPVLSYSTYLGGSGFDGAADIAVDSSGNVYVTGTAYSTNFTGVNSSSFQPTYGGGAFGDAFVTKLNADGTALIYSTYLGGSGDDGASGIAVDAAGNAYVSGGTRSTNFPGIGPTSIQSVYDGFADGFVAKLNATGTALLYSTYMGGADVSGSESSAQAIAVDSSGNAYVTGSTDSTSFPGVTSSSFQSSPSQFGDAFVAKINPSGTALVYSSYLGGNGGNDQANRIAVDTSGNAYVAGYTDSTNFPGTSSSTIQSVYGGGFLDGFVVKVNATGSALVYSTYLGGSAIDEADGIAVDSLGNAYVTGQTVSANFPGISSNSIQSTYGGSTDGFVAQLNPTGTALVYSTYLGGSGQDAGFGIAVDSSGNAYVTGDTASTNFPGASSSSIQPTYGGGPYDAFVAEISAGGTALLYSTYLGGSGQDLGSNVAIDSSGNVYVAGSTASTNFPGVSSSSIQPTIGGGGLDAFVAKIGASSSPAAAVTALTNLLSSSSLGLTSGEIRSLTTKLNNVLASIQAGLNKQAINQLNALISSVQSSVKTGKISIQAGNTLINDANAIVAAL